MYYVGDMTTGDIGALILNIIESSMEDTRIPDAIAAYADKRAGKTVTKTDAEQLEAQIGVPRSTDRRPDTHPPPVRHDTCLMGHE